MENIFSWISVIFRYIFIIVIYYFLYQVIKLMLTDIKSQNAEEENCSYLKLINRRETLPFSIKEHYSLSSNPFTIGRGASNSLVISDSYVSKKHCEIIENEGFYFIKDLDSANGTFYNGKRLEDVAKLKNGDRIGIGEVSFLFVEGSK